MIGIKSSVNKDHTIQFSIKSRKGKVLNNFVSLWITLTSVDHFGSKTKWWETKIEHNINIFNRWRYGLCNIKMQSINFWKMFVLVNSEMIGIKSSVNKDHTIQFSIKSWKGKVLNWQIQIVNVLYIDLRPGKTCHSKVMPRKEVTHSDGSYEKKSHRQIWLKKWDKVKIPWYTHRLMHRKRVTSELHDSYFRLMTIKHTIPMIEWAIELLYNLVKTGNQWVGDQTS